jgi:hypothetical protein
MAVAGRRGSSEEVPMWVMYSVVRKGDVVKAYVGIADRWEEVAHIRDGRLHKGDVPIPAKVEEVMWEVLLKRKRAMNPVLVLELPNPAPSEIQQSLRELLAPHAAAIECAEP